MAVKLTLAATFMIIAAVASVTVLSIRREERAFRAELRQQAELLLNTLAASAADPLYYLDADALSDMVAGLSRGATVVSGRVYDRDGRILADARDPSLELRFESDRFGQWLVRSDVTVFEWKSDRLVAGLSVTAGRQRLGAVSVELSTAPLAAKVAATRRQGFGVGIVATAFGALLAVVVSRSITRPLLELTGASRRIAAGDLSQQIIARSGDELAALADAFNTMVTRLRESMDTLEQRVRDRTLQLSEREQALRKANAFLEYLIAASPGVIFQLNLPTFDPIYVSPSIGGMLGYPAETFVAGGATFWTTLIHPDDVNVLMTEFTSLQEQTSNRAAVESRVRHQDGGFRWLHFVALAEHDNAGKPVSILGYLFDISEHKSVEAAVRQAKEEAEQASRAKSDFLSRMSHELRTPLNAILGFAQLLEMDAATADQRESAEHILRGGKHLLQLIDEVLDIARIEAGRLTISPEPVPLGDVVRECLQLIAPLAAQRHILLDGQITHTTDQYVLADRQRLKQVLLNLLSNAVKYNREQGTVAVSLEEEPRGRMRIKVRDTGRGIPPEMLGRLFTPFERLEAGERYVEGTGIGLALSRRLVELMGGSIGVESQVGQGSTFWVELPSAKGLRERHERVWNETPRQVGTGAAGTLLYIEDNLANLDLIQQILAQRPEVELLAAMQGRLGLDLARQHRPDLILLDLHLPDIPGEEVLRRLRETSETSAIPVVVLTASSSVGETGRLRALGARECLGKPLDVKRFLALLDVMLRDRNPVSHA